MRGLVAAIWLLLCLGALADPASAKGVDLGRTACVASLPDSASDAQVAAAGYRCGVTQGPGDRDWLWLRLDAASLRDLPARWQLLVDQTRFDQIALLVEGPAGPKRTVLSADQLAGHGAPGGMLRFRMDPPGASVRGLYLGFRQIDDLSLMRKVRAVPAADQAVEDGRWLLLMGLFAGTLLSALLYNLVIHAGRRHAFQRWYLAWVALAFAYGMVWTNLASFLLPWLVGPIAVRLDYMLVGFMIAAGNLFFFAVLEEGLLPRWLRNGGRLIAGAGALVGVIAALDTGIPAALSDRWLNYTVALTALWVAMSCVVAIQRGSRVIWFYLIGWGPVICVFLARLTRNLGIAPQNDVVDMATFAALAFEALVLSLAIADRFRMLGHELAVARRRREIDRIEAKALRLLAQTDFLTGLGNRNSFQDAMRGLVDRATPFSLLLIDVDFLKDTNDRLGHAGGDALLRQISADLSAIALKVPDAQVARIGGDEFALIFPSDEMLEVTLLERIGDLQGKSWRFSDQERAQSLSIGSARFPDDAEDPELLYQNADLALYHAKRLGRGRHYRYDPLLRILRDMQVEFTGDAEAALAEDRFRLFLQPIVDLATGSCCGYEALLRWDHPEHGLMLPDRFADVLVAPKIGTRIQEHVLEMALGLLRDHAGQIEILSVNFTSAQLAGPRAARRVLDRLAHYGVPPTSLCIEVTEGVMLDRAADNILATLRTLHKAGVRIALDDFGTGFASLVHLRRMPVDRIKIDRSFIAGLDETEGGSLAIVRAIIGLGQGLGKIVVAEGIETETQAAQLRQLGCHLGQGFLYGRAEPSLPAIEGPDAEVPPPSILVATARDVGARPDVTSQAA